MSNWEFTWYGTRNQPPKGHISDADLLRAHNFNRALREHEIQQEKDEEEEDDDE